METNNIKRIIKINGMSCDHCKKAVENALSELGDYNELSVNLETKTAEVSYKEDVSIEAIKKAITDEGYEVEDIY